MRTLPVLIDTPIFNNFTCSVGIGSDYDGVASTPVGLEDIATYPALVRVLAQN